jgi:hypothetical protein
VTRVFFTVGLWSPRLTLAILKLILMWANTLNSDVKKMYINRWQTVFVYLKYQYWSKDLKLIWRKKMFTNCLLLVEWKTQRSKSIK